jgi:multimeric flavodoxin WrbA
LHRCPSGEKSAGSITRGAGDAPFLRRELPKTDALVFAMPVYVDAVPSHVLELLQFIEAFARENSLGFKVHAICNCGFYEGAHCET